MDIQDSLTGYNIAEKLDEEKLIKIGNDVVEGYETDENSRSGWISNLEE